MKLKSQYKLQYLHAKVCTYLKQLSVTRKCSFSHGQLLMFDREDNVLDRTWP